MESLKVSVIVPVYNAESTIRKCLDSLVNQTLSGWELILVDDGSTDNSGNICDEYARKCAELSGNKVNIRVIHWQNGGVSAARQTGLDAVQGEYVIHADPDDWVEPLMLEELYELAKTEDADMVICDFFCDIDGKSIYRCQAPTSMRHEDVLNNMFGKEVHGSCCNKLIRKQCIMRYDAHFPVGINYCEDVCFNVQLLKHDTKIAYLPKAYYHYVQSASSITNNYTRKTFESQKQFVDFLTTQLPSDSEPVVKSKLLVKKLAFRNSILPNNELLDLYPDIKRSNERKCFFKWMYNSAFNGHFIISSALRYALNILHK